MIIGSGWCFLAVSLLPITSLDTVSFQILILISCKTWCLRAPVCAATGAKQKWSNILIQSNESMPCPVINTKLISSCETDRPGSAVKGQDAEELLIPLTSVLNEKSFYWNKNNQTIVNLTLEKVFLLINSESQEELSPDTRRHFVLLQSLLCATLCYTFSLWY